MNMASDRSSRIVAPSGLRTPSPTKSRLPLGSSLPQRSASVKGLSNVSLQPPLRMISIKDPEIPKKPVVPRTRLQQSSRNNSHTSHTESNLKPSTPADQRPKPNITLGQRALTASNVELASSTTPQTLIFSRESLEPRLELLHLHAIHKRSSINQTEWKEHACEHYKKQFEGLQHQHQELNQLEIEALCQRNAAAILSWCRRGIGFEKQMQALSNVVTQVDQLTSPAGRYTLVIQAFEHWVASSTAIHDQRHHSTKQRKTNIIEGLGDGWLAEVESLQSKVIDFADIMLGLVEPDTGGSDLERTIAVTSEMLKNMLEELEMILKLETMVVQEEKDWIEGSVANITKDLNIGLSLG